MLYSIYLITFSGRTPKCLKMCSALLDFEFVNIFLCKVSTFNTLWACVGTTRLSFSFIKTNQVEKPVVGNVIYAKNNSCVDKMFIYYATNKNYFVYFIYFR